jgi:hypothetical protein
MDVTPIGTVNVEVELNVWVTGDANVDAVTIMLSVDEAHPVFETVQRSVYAPTPPAGVKVAVGLVKLENCEVDKEGPDTIDHVPVPAVGVFPAREMATLPHDVKSAPALAVVGVALLVNTTSSVEAVQGALLMVQRKVTLDPLGTPVTVVVGEEALVIVPVPLTTVHAPVPTAAVLAARVKVPLPQLDWSEPALAVVGVWLMVTACEAVAVHPSAEVMVTVYVPEALNVFAAVFTLLPPLQAYVLPPEAVNETEPQPVLVPEMEATGTVFTVTDCEAVAVHPATEVTITV